MHETVYREGLGEGLGFQQVEQKLLIAVPLDGGLHLAAACSLSLAVTWSA